MKHLEGVSPKYLLPALLDTLPSGLMVRIKNGPVLLWNRVAEEITGVAREAVVGCTGEDLTESVRCLIEHPSREYTLHLPDGQPRSLEKHHASIALGDSRTGEVVVFSDITGLVQARQQMERFLLETSESRDLMEEQAARLAMALAEVDEKNEIIQEKNRHMIQELEMAGKLQKSLLPDIYESFNGVSLATKYIPSMNIGGDLYDVVDLGQGITGFIIADVSGHGVAAALVASMFKMSFHSLAFTVASPKVLFHILNEEIKSIVKEDYITAFYLLADRFRGGISYANAGHPTPLLLRRASGRVEELDTDGFFIGMFDDGDYDEMSLSIDQDDALLLYTDCLLETEDAQGNQFGKQRLKELFVQVMSDAHGQEAIDRIEAAVRAFAARDTFEDDFTVLLLEFTEFAQGVPAGEETSPGDLSSGDFVEF